MKSQRRTTAARHHQEAAEARELARAHTPAAIARLVHWLESDNDRASIAAAAALLDRGWGKVDTKADTAPPTRIAVIRAPKVAKDMTEWQQRYRRKS
jgi:hypothetical protein